MKNRMSALDCRRMVAELQKTVVGMWLHNVYDLNAKTFVLKLSVPEKPKALLLIESGVRFHLTEFKREKSNIPSGFSMKLRKHIRGRKCLAVEQVGTDRVIDLTFGYGVKCHHLIVELYASGNIILTDGEYNILSLLRTHTYDDNVKVAVREKYVLDMTHAAQSAKAAAARALAGEGEENEKATEGRGEEGQKITPVADAAGATATAPVEQEPVVEIPPITAELLTDFFQTMLEPNSSVESQANTSTDAAHDTVEGATDGKASTDKGGWAKGKTRSSKPKPAKALKQALLNRTSPVQGFGADLVEHALLQAGLTTACKFTSEWFEQARMIGTDEKESLLVRLAASLQQCPGIFAAFGDPTTISKGYIVLEPIDGSTATQKEKMNVKQQKQEKINQGVSEGASIDVGQKGGEGGEHASKENNAGVSDATAVDGKQEASGEKQEQQVEAEEGPVRYYSSFQPMKYEQFAGEDVLELDSFNQAVDKYFSAIEVQKAEKELAIARVNAAKRVGKIKQDQEQRLVSLDQAVKDEDRKAELLRCNLEDVNNAILVIRSAVASGMDWDEIAQVVKREKQMANPVASLISGLKLSENKITLLLWDEENDNAQQPAVRVDVDINLSAHANIALMYDSKKRAATKAIKTAESAAKAIEDAQRKTDVTLEKQKNKRKTIAISRKVYWFEKFNWFVTSDGYLVLSGRDAQQNELIVKRYMRKSQGDVYVHADLHGAASCVIRNLHPKRGEIPPETLMQAGAMTVCRSSAWNAKIIISAWWVNADQVSKTAPTGEYLPTGSFMVRGKKNFLAPARLWMGFGYIFRYDETAMTDEDLARKRGKEWRMMPVALSHREGDGDAEGLDDGNENDDDEIDDCGASGGGVVSDVQVESDNNENGEGIVDVLLEDDGNDKEVDVGGDDDAHGVGESAAESEADGKYVGEDDDDDDEHDDSDDDDDDDDDEEQSDEEQSDRVSTEDIAPVIDGEEAVIKDNNSDEKKEEEEAGDKAEETDRDQRTTTTTGGNNNQKHEQAGHAPLTAKQRREIRKLRKLGVDVSDVTKLTKAQTGGGGEGQQQPKHDNKNKNKNKKKQQEEATVGRGGDGGNKTAGGRRGKGKKKAKRYAEQDAEERELAMIALGNPLPKPNTDSSPTADNDDNNEGEHVGTKGGGGGNAYGGKKRTNNKPQRTQAMDEEDREKDAALGIASAQDAEGVLVYMTAKPEATDGLLYAIPMCAPYAAMAHLKYKVKLTPGSMKKGRAFKSATELLLRQNKSQGDAETERELNLIRTVNEIDGVQAMVGNVKISAPGAAKEGHKKITARGMAKASKAKAKKKNK